MDEHSCETCKCGKYYRQGYDITMLDDECGGCCSWNDKWQPIEKVVDPQESEVEE